MSANTTNKGLITHIDALVRERAEDLECLVLVLRLETLCVETRRDDRFDQRIEERDKRVGERRSEGMVVPLRTLRRELVARVKTLHSREKRKEKKTSAEASLPTHEMTHLSDDVTQAVLRRILEQL